MLQRKDFTWAVIAFALIVLSPPVLADNKWATYHWERASNAIALDLRNNVNKTWGAHLDQASMDWNDSPALLKVITTTVVPGTTKPRRCKAQKGNVQVCNNTYGNNGWLGIAGIAISGDHITAGYVKVNDTYFNTATYNYPEWRQYVMCQEVGHTFGLGHVNTNFYDDNIGSCMDYTDNPLDGNDNTMPNLHDYETLKGIYAHVDEVAEEADDDGGGCNPRSPKCKGVSAADILASIPANGLSGWGRLISAHGPQEIYQVNLGGGQKIITFVTWTLERANDHGH